MGKVVVKYKSKDDNEQYEYKSIGTAEYTTDCIILSFKEQVEMNVISEFKIFKEKIELNRTGDVQMNLTFINKEKTKGVYKTDFGYHILPYIYTENMYSEEGKIKIGYRFDFDYENLHNIEIEYYSKINK